MNNTITITGEVPTNPIRNIGFTTQQIDNYTLFHSGREPLTSTGEKMLQPKIMDKIKNNIEHLESKLSKYKELKEKAKQLKFKEGDVAFHKVLGNVLVKNIIMKEDTFILHTNIKGDFGYEVLNIEKTEIVNPEDLLEKSDMTEVLYK